MHPIFWKPLPKSFGASTYPKPHSEDWQTKDGKPIGIGGDPSGATAEKGRIILETSARELVPGLLEIRNWKI